jgi:succinate dehydrogenase/fumarate reductase cytochrome b subunit
VVSTPVFSSTIAAKLLTQPQNSWLTIGSSDLLKWDFLVACSSTSFRDWRLLSAIKPKGKKNTEPLPAMPTANGTLVAWESWEVYFRHFWVVSRFTDAIQETAGSTLFDEMIIVFTDPIAVLIYVIGCISLAYHLLHGFQSAFQSMGINHPAYSPIIKSVGTAFSIIVPLVFAAMPIAMHLGWIK